MSFQIIIDMTDKEVFDAYKKAFGENLKKIRKQRINTLRAVDTNTKYDASNYHKYEIGIGNPTLETLLTFAISLGIHPKELLDFDFDLSQLKNK